MAHEATRHTAAPSRERNDEVQDLLHRYCVEEDLEARTSLIERFRPMAGRLARRYWHPQGEALEDLEQVAVVGLIKALDRFDPERGFAFVSFATPTIIGELRRHFRDGTGGIHLPRHLQEDIFAVERAIERLSTRTGKSPTVLDIAEETGLDEEAVLEALAAARETNLHSLDSPAPGSSDDSPPVLGDQCGETDSHFELVEYGASVSGVLDGLSERDRRVVHFRFVEDLTQTEIAERVGVSQMQISRILTRVLRELREAAGEDA